MYRGLMSWMRVVLPRGDLVLLGIGGEVAIEVLYLAFFWGWNGFVDENLFRKMRFYWLFACSGAYGVYRMICFHPLVDSRYREWLRRSPWTADKPLPGGPLHLVLQDLVVISILCLLFRTPSPQTLYFPTTFLFTYQFTLAISARILGHWKLAYLMGFILGGVIFVGDRPHLAFVVADSGIIVTRFAITYALRSFPWDLPWQAEVCSFDEMAEVYKLKRMGWPYDQMSPQPPARYVPIYDGVCLSILVGWWWIVALEYLTPQERSGAATIAFGFVMVFFAFSRVSHYVISNRPPIGLFGRIFTLRWVIPGYDKIFVAPVLAIVIGAAIQQIAIGQWVPNAQGIPVNPQPGIFISGMGVTSFLLILLVMGPRLEYWRLNGKHRVVFDLKTMGTKDFLEL